VAVSDQFLFELTEGVAWLTLNQPERMNAMSNDMMRGLSEALGRCATDDDVRAIVLTGAGDRAFCAGGDVKGMASQRGRRAHQRRFADGRGSNRRSSPGDA
jgi:enoyl-CoA hydratase/carnithine racemase